MLSSFKKEHNIKPKCEISLSLQGSECRRSQEFRLRAAQNRNVQTLDFMIKYGAICLVESRFRFPSTWDNYVVIAFGVACNFLRGYN